jgi:formamidopyrimidine-DNA glycosylase
MPELPEVETLCRQLRAVIMGEEVISTLVIDPKLEGIKVSRGQRVTDIVRHGKWFAVVLSGGAAIRFHLRMTGRLLHCTGAQVHPHARFMIRFRNCRLYLIDPRRFATVTLNENGVGDLPGQDAMQNCSADRLIGVARKRKVSVKTFLLDQKTIAGIGNIYACEILHAAGIYPDRQVSKVTRREWNKILAVMLLILKSAIDCRGTSVSDWHDLFGKKGEHQMCLQVYKREGESCPCCGSKIRRIVQSGRSTFYCPTCQK